jgi:hypothetical protein
MPGIMLLQVAMEHLQMGKFFVSDVIKSFEKQRIE